MRQRIVEASWLLCALRSARPAHAQALRVCTWFSVRDANRRSAHSFILAPLRGGGLRYDNGGAVLTLKPSGKSAPEPFQPSVMIVTNELTPISFRFEEIVEDRVIRRMEQRLSPDGKRLIGRRTSIEVDGQESAREVKAVRIGPGRGLAGEWRQLPPPRPHGSSTPLRPVQPFWIITQDVAGIITWTIPVTGGILKGRADGRPYPVSGTLAPPGRTSTLKKLSRRHLLWSFYENGHLVEHAEDRLSADGQLWTDLIWRPRYPAEKDRLYLPQGMIHELGVVALSFCSTRPASGYGWSVEPEAYVSVPEASQSRHLTHPRVRLRGLNANGAFQLGQACLQSGVRVRCMPHPR